MIFARRTSETIIARMMLANGYPRDVAVAMDELRRAHQRAGRKLRVAGIPEAAWQALNRVERQILLFKIMGGESSAKVSLLVAAIEAREIFDAAASGKLRELRRSEARL